MVSTPSKQKPASGPVNPAPAAARFGLGGQQIVNPMLAAPLLVHTTAIMAATAAVGFGMMNQFSAIMLGAMEGALGAGSKPAPLSTISDSHDGVAARAPSIRVVVDNGPQAVEETVVTDKAPVIAEKRLKAAKPVGSTSRSRASKGAADDLKRISGIGPKLEKVLNDKGLRRFSDVARLSADAADALDMELGLGGRVKRDQWIAQAKALAKENV